MEGITEVSGWVAGWEHTSEREKLEGLCQARPGAALPTSAFL